MVQVHDPGRTGQGPLRLADTSSATTDAEDGGAGGRWAAWLAGSAIGPRLGRVLSRPPDAVLAECTCPDGCVRDHEFE